MGSRTRIVPDTGVPVNPLPQLLTYRGIKGSLDHLPDEALLNRIRATRPFWFVIYDSLTSLGGGIGAQQTDRGQVTVQFDCWLVSLLASSSQAAGFAAQIYDSEREVTFMDTDILSPNFAGTALRQFYLKEPQKLPAGGQMESRIINLATVSNTIQIVGFGLRPDPRKKVT
jgi:hypothetical protein